MTMGSEIAAALATDVLLASDFVEPAILLQETEGIRDAHGEFVPGASVQTAINLVSAPMGFAGRGAGQERLAVPEGLRDEDLRVFWYPGTISSLHYGLADGDLIVPGVLGPVTNTFNGDSRLQAESFRNQYASIAPGWFARYQADSSQLTRLTGFGASVFELYDAVEGHWILAPTYQAVNAANWGSFTEVLGVRKDPGNV